MSIATMISNKVPQQNNSKIGLKQKSILDLPDEVIEMMISFLSFCDLYKLRKQGKRLADCTERVLKKKPFSKYNLNDYVHDNIAII